VKISKHVAVALKLSMIIITRKQMVRPPAFLDVQFWNRMDINTPLSGQINTESRHQINFIFGCSFPEECGHGDIPL